MGLSEFYDNVILRDLLEYAAPGAVVVSGLGLIQEAASKQLGLGISIVETADKHPWPLLFLFLFSAYVMGHILTSVHSWLFRNSERNSAFEVLGQEKWLKARMVEVISRQMGTSDYEVDKLLDDGRTAEIFREIGRAIIHSQAPQLHREYVNRHSILSRFCQNMVIAIALFLVLLLIAVYASWSELTANLQSNVSVVFNMTAFVLLIGILAIVALYLRSSRLRRSMARHTFEIWLVESLQLTKTETSPGSRMKTPST